MDVNAEEAGEAGPQGVIAAVDRALGVLLALGRLAAPVTLTALARDTGLYKSTLLRTLASLEHRRFAARQADGRWRLGPALLHLGAACRDSLDLHAVVRPALQAIVEATGESGTFFVREGAWRVCLMRAESRQNVRDHIPEGAMLPLDRGAAGHVLTRFAAPERIAPPLVIASLGERDPEMAAIAAPVFGDGQRLIGALSGGGTRTRFLEPGRYAAVETAVRRQARILTDLLGGDPGCFGTAE